MLVLAAEALSFADLQHQRSRLARACFSNRHLHSATPTWKPLSLHALPPVRLGPSIDTFIIQRLVMAAGASGRDSRSFLNNTLGDNADINLGDTNNYYSNEFLPVVREAAFDSHAGEYDARCLPGTRVDLLAEIIGWATGLDRESIFWLSGMAGTGKSTIARTVAEKLQILGVLGASFFFKRGEAWRNKAERFVTTIAHQLMNRIPALEEWVRDAVKKDTSLPYKGLGEQFDKLILQPLSTLQEVGNFVIVIDALDECERDDDIRNIIRLFAKAGEECPTRLRVFVTSRPQQPIRLGFSRMTSGYQDFILHQISTDVIRGDISAFLKHQLRETAEDEDLGETWPGYDNFQALLKICLPLFIYAATVCRFIRDRKIGHPSCQLDKVLKSQIIGMGYRIGGAYKPVLDNLLDDSWPPEQKKAVISEFRFIAGSIIVLFDPLSASSLAALLSSEVNSVRTKLGHLHSVLNISEEKDAPIRLLHLSFREFLTDEANKDVHSFWVDERERHRELAAQCVKVMGAHLRKDICNLQAPGVRQSDVKPEQIQQYLLPHIRYACVYWTDHLLQAQDELDDGDLTDAFLREHFLHWVEAMCLLGCGNKCHSMISGLQHLTPFTKKLHALLHDASRFILYCLPNIREFPMQIYSSALIFAPERSLVKGLHHAEISQWTPQLSSHRLFWDALLQQFEGLKTAGGCQSSAMDLAWAKEVGFLSDGSFVLLSYWPPEVSYNWRDPPPCIRVFNRMNGHCTFEKLLCQDDIRTISRCRGWLAFAPIRSTSLRSRVEIWDLTAAACVQSFEFPPGETVKRVAFSDDGRKLVSATSIAPNTFSIKIWNLQNMQCLSDCTFCGRVPDRMPLALSDNGECFAFGGSTIRFEDNEAATTTTSAEHYRAHYYASTGNVELWSVANRERIFNLRFQKTPRATRQLFFALGDSRIVCHETRWDHNTQPGHFWIWNVGFGDLLHSLNAAQTSTLSHDCRWIAVYHRESDVIVVRSVPGDQAETTVDVQGADITALEFSPNDNLLVTTTLAGFVQVWDVSVRAQDLAFENQQRHPSDRLRPDRITIHNEWLCVEYLSLPWHDQLSIWNTVIGIWNTATGKLVIKLVAKRFSKVCLQGQFLMIFQRKGYKGTVKKIFLPLIRQSHDLVDFSGYQTVCGNEVVIDNIRPSRERSFRYSDIREAKVAYSPDGQWGAFDEGDGSISVLDLLHDTDSYHFKLSDTEKEWSRQMCFTSDARLMAVLTFDGLGVWDLERREMSQTIPTASKKWDTMDHMSFSPDGRHLACMNLGVEAVWVWDLKSGTYAEALDTSSQVSPSWNLDQTNFILQTKRGTVAIYLHEGPGKSSQSPEFRYKGWGLNFYKDWITFDSVNLLWIPPNWRTDEGHSYTSFDIQDSVFAFTDASWALHIWNFGDAVPVV